MKIATLPEADLQVVKAESFPPCSHPLCDTLHRRYQVDGEHTVTRTYWAVINEAGDHLEQFDTKREAQEWLDRHVGAAAKRFAAANASTVEV